MLLVLELAPELLEPLAGGGGLLGGGVCGGVCGGVGVLALGQPDRSRQRQAKRPKLHNRRSTALLLNVECLDKFFRLYWLSGLETWPEGGLAQLLHQARGLPVIRCIVINAL